MGVAAIFPLPFCSLTQEHSGFGRWDEPYRKSPVTCFARHFGRPSFTLKTDGDGQRIEEVVVIRGAPCGSTHFTAAKKKGTLVAEVVPSGGLIALHYPCLDSMHLQRIDGQVETLMHVSGRIVNEELETSIGHLLEPRRR